MPPGLGQVILAAVLALVPATHVDRTQVGPAPDMSAPAWSRCPEWYSTALEVGWPESEWPTIDRVMKCESQCSPKAHNRSGASGLMQIMPLWWNGRDPYDPTVNLTMALEVHERQGWRAWSCY
jgi:hypothetical protein